MQKIGHNLILCPGFMNDRGLWTHMEESLAAFGRCQFIDQSQDASLSDIAYRALRTAPSQFTLIGFSMGGYVAQEILHLAPQCVSGLVLINTSARPDTRKKLHQNRELIEITQNHGFHGLSKKALRNSVHPNRRHDEALINLLQNMALRMAGPTFLKQLAFVRRDYRPALKDINCPTLIICSQQDRLRTLEEAQELAENIPNARLEIMDDCGHMGPLEQPKKITQTLSNWFSEIDL